MATGDGLVSMTPSSIAHSGTSASINADGGVDFTAVSSLSLNGVFTSDYDNYLIVFTATGNNNNVECRLRVSGSDATAGNYAYQTLNAGSTTVSGARNTSQTEWITFVDSSTVSDGGVMHVYGPALAQPTAYRTVTVGDAGSGVQINDRAGTHSLSTAYDGITFYRSGISLTGTVHVFGYEE